MTYLISDRTGQLLDARIDVIGSSVILHSRGGSSRGGVTRNEGHGSALMQICRRARQHSGCLERVLIDSAVARRRPEHERVLIQRDEIEKLDGEALAAAIRPRLRRFGQQQGVKGGNSTRQLRFDFTLSREEVVSILRLRRQLSLASDSEGAPRRRLSAERLRQVLPIHIRQAVDELVSGQDAPRFSESRDYVVLTPSGDRLAPKKVFGLAIEHALGIEAFPAHFSAGRGHPCFAVIEEAGFTIVAKRETARQLEESSPALPLEQEERSWAEGSRRFANHLRTERKRSRQASAAKRMQVRRRNGGRLACENPACTTDWYAVFPLVEAEAVFEIHHKHLVSAMEQDHRTALEDLQCLCASCHRAAHRSLALERSWPAGPHPRTGR